MILYVGFLIYIKICNKKAPTYKSGQNRKNSDGEIRTLDTTGMNRML